MTGAAQIARALLAIADAVRAHAHQGLCCSEHTTTVERDGQLYWRRNEWLADQWAPLGSPGSSIDTGKVKPKRSRKRP